jgi:hypothetical protein
MVKLKDLVEDLELGKVYTDKDRPPFQVKEETISEGPDADLGKKLKQIQNQIYKLGHQYKSKANVPAMMHSFMIGVKNQLKKDKMVESKTSDMMKAIRKGPKAGPWILIVSKNNKVVSQVSVKNLKEIPAYLAALRPRYSNHRIGIEAKSGKIVYREQNSD